MWHMAWYLTCMLTMQCHVPLRERISRQNRLRDTLYHAEVSSSLGPTREGRAFLPGLEARPADIYIPLWEDGRDAALDVTVV